jgi:hypothetical protein
MADFADWAFTAFLATITAIAATLTGTGRRSGCQRMQLNITGKPQSTIGMPRTIMRRPRNTMKAAIMKKRRITHTQQADTPAMLDIMLKKREKRISKSMDTSST